MRKILILLLLLPIICQAQYTQQIGATKTTDTTKIISQVKFTSLATSDTNKVLGINSNGQLVWRIKGGGLEGDSAQTVFSRGRNTTIPLRFGSGANTVNTTIDSTTVFVGLSGGLYSSITPGVFRSLSTGGTESYDYKYNGIQKTDRSTNRTTSLYLPNSPGGNLDIYTQAKSGTTAYLSDFNDTLLGRNVLFATDTLRLSGSKNVVTQAQLNTHSLTSVNLNGNTVGGTMVYGIVDSYNLVTRTFNLYDTIQAGGKHVINGKNGEVIMELKNKVPATGVTQTKAVLIGVGTGVTDPLNEGFVAFGANVGNTIPRISQSGLLGYSVLSMRSTTTAGTTILPAFQAGNTGNCIRIGLGSYTNASPNAPTTGNYNVLSVGTASESTGLWSPSSGTANLRAYTASIRINASGSYSGTIKAYTDDSMIFSGTASATYIAYDANKNIGWGFRQANGGVLNTFVGRTLIGTTTDNTVDALQVSGDISMTTAGNKIKIATGTNSSLNTATLSGGTVTVSTTAVTASSKIFLQSKGDHHVKVSAIVAGTSFTITSSNGSDASDVDYWIIN